jgi:hypothetical protein
MRQGSHPDEMQRVVMRSSRVVVLDSSLQANEGHHDHFVRHARRDFADRGIEMVVHRSSRIAPLLSQELQIIPSFSRGLYDPRSQDCYDGLLVDVLTRAETFAEEAERCLVASASPGDMVLLPTATIEELTGLMRLAQRLAPTYRLALLFHRAGSGVFKPVGPGTLSGALLRNLGRQLSVFASKGLWIGGVTEPLCASLSAALNHPVHLAPCPLWYGGARARPTAPRRRIGFLGHLRVEKGSLNLLALTKALSVAVPQATCVIGGHLERGGVDITSYQDLAASGADVQFGWRDEEAFADLMASCDVIVLPYDPVTYSDTCSGIFCHAVAHGIPVVTPAGTWMASQIGSGRAAGLVYRGDSLQNAVATIAEAVNRISWFGPQAVARADAWRRQECGGRLVEQLFSFGFGG